MEDARSRQLVDLYARLAVGAVFVVNIACALAFIFQPTKYAPAFELQGAPGLAAVQGFGILFLMWNATYPAFLLRPHVRMTLLGVILVQQVIGVLGETWIYLSLPAGHATLRAAGLRFILFDAFGLALIASTLFILMKLHPNREKDRQ